MATKYSRGTGKHVKKAMRKMKEGNLKSGQSGKKVTSRKQAVAIGLSEARESGERVPEKSDDSNSKGSGSTSKKSTKKKSSSSKSRSFKASKKSAKKKSGSKKSTKKKSAKKKSR
jgi:hypothetical protein